MGSFDLDFILSKWDQLFKFSNRRIEDLKLEFLIENSSVK